MGVLSASQLFEHLPEEDRAQLERSVEVREYAAGQEIFRESAPGDALYVILEGRVEISCLVSPKERRVLARLVPGDFFGEMALIDDQPRSATATAQGKCRLASMPAAAVTDALGRSPAFARAFMREISRRMRDFNHTYTQEVLQAERLGLVGRFARSIVHDFKNPLNIIGISADMSAMEEATPAMRQAAQARIRRQIDRLSSMISELLEFTRGGGGTVVMARVEYGPFLRDTVGELRMEVEARGSSVSIEGGLPAEKVAMDPRRLAHVFANLIHNACDAMTGGGRIWVTARVEGKDVITEIRDSGPGIAPEIAGRLFEPFATHGKPSGTGLGLSICRRIVEDHGGNIRAGNAPEGGAVFSLSLPIQTRAGE